MLIRFRQITGVLSLWFMIQACEPCNDCGVALEINPSVDAIFINRDSLVIIEDSLAVNIDTTNALDSIQLLNSTELRVITDSIALVEDSIANENFAYENLLPSLLFREAVLNDYILSIDTIIYVQDSFNLILRDIQTVINSGLIKPARITILNLEKDFYYEDSATTFNLPLVLSENLTQYEIIIADESFYLDVSYETGEILNEKRELRISATNIFPMSDSFDSLKYDCNAREICINNETTITLYF